MPLHRQVLRLEEISLNQFSDLCASTCTRLEEQALEPSVITDPDATNTRKTKAETKLTNLIKLLPGPLLELVIPNVIRSMASSVRKNRSFKGLLKALECLPQSNIKRLDIGGLFSEVRLYGEVNAQCKILLRSSLQRLPILTHLNLESKCNDDMLLELARHCPSLEDLHVPMSDITDRGLMALCGISVTSNLEPGQGCFKIVRLGLYNCMIITLTGVGSVLRNLPNLVNLSYDKLADAIETVAKIDGDYMAGKRIFKIVHLDQFSEYYDFESHPDVLSILLKACPYLESLRFYLSDEGCKNLSQIGNIKHLQLEMEDVGNGFRLLTRQFTHLQSLQLTFRTMPFSQLIDIADNCPQLSVLRLIGFDISESHILVSHSHIFSNLKVVDIRMVRQLDPFEEEDVNVDTQDTITPQLLHFLIDFSYQLEELTIEAGAGFLNEAFLCDILAKNSLSKVSKLRLSVNPAQSLTLRVAKHVIESLPMLKVFAVSRWNISGRELRALKQDVKKKNLDLIFV